MSKKPTPVVQKQDKNVVRGKAPARRNVEVYEMITRGWGSGAHRSRGREEQRGALPPKHKKDPRREEYMMDPKIEALTSPTARFEEGKPADPTKNMSPEDAAEWKKQNEAHKDEFAKAASDTIEVEYKVQGMRDWKKVRIVRRLFDDWVDKMAKKPGFEINPDSIETHSEDYLRSLLASAWGPVLSRVADLADETCWEGYEAYGFKEKDGQSVPNCLPVKKASHPLDRVRGHQLWPASVSRKVPALYSQEKEKDPVAWVKLFSPYSNAVWYITEYDPSSHEAFGWADLGMGGGELGYISIRELEGANKKGLPLVERDLYWKPMPLSRAKSSRMASEKKAAMGGHHYVAPNGKVYVDTAFLNSIRGIPGTAVEHMGFGEFYADTPHGRVDFDRMRGVDFPGQSGRSHQMYGEGDSAKWLLQQMISKGQTEDVGGRTASDDHTAKFPKGVEMTVDEVAKVVGPEFKEKNENPPESVVSLREEMTSMKTAARDPGMNALAAFMRSYTGGGRGLPVQMESVRPNVVRILAGEWRDTPEEEVKYWVELINQKLPKMNEDFDARGSVDQRWKLLVAPYYKGAKGHGDILEMIPTHRTPARVAAEAKDKTATHDPLVAAWGNLMVVVADEGSPEADKAALKEDADPASKDQNLAPTWEKVAYDDSKGLEFDFSDGFSFTTVPIDPYGQVYTGYILMKKPGKLKAYSAAMEFIRQNRSQIQSMRRIQDVLDAINGYVLKKTGQRPYWHRYLMPD